MTREEAVQYLENYRKMFADIAPEKFIEALDVILADPLLSNLDEAAEKYANNEHPDESCVGRWGAGDYESPIDREYDREIAKDAFKAGAEWAIKQLKEK